jgi:hypothetical protein
MRGVLPQKRDAVGRVQKQQAEAIALKGAVRATGDTIEEGGRSIEATLRNLYNEPKRAKTNQRARKEIEEADCTTTEGHAQGMRIREELGNNAKYG